MGQKWWVFERVTPLTIIFILNLHLHKFNPAYAPEYFSTGLNEDIVQIPAKTNG